MPIEQQIVLEPVANGWLVILPVKYEMRDPNQHMIDGVISAVKEMRNGKDDLLKEIKEQNENLPFPSDSDTIEIKKTDNIFIFRKFEDVLGFLKYKIEDKAAV